VALVKIALASGDELSVEVDQVDLPDDLALASPDLGRATGRLAASLEDGLDVLQPVLEGIAERVKAARPQEFSVEFGIKVGGEAGIYIAKGTTEVNFVITAKWASPDSCTQSQRANEDAP
jgi:NTP-dependent ternary system trypsin peptidase co-occuring protein